MARQSSRLQQALRSLRLLRRGLDAWFLTLVHYIGIGMLLYAIAIDKFRNPGLLPAAVMLILLRGVAGGGGDE